MIKTINEFTFKSFKNYNLPSDMEFKEKNIIFGYNGKGKSSLAHGILQEIKNHFIDKEYRVYLNHSSSLRLDDEGKGRIRGIKAIFGEKNVEIKNKIEELKSKKHNLDDLYNRITSIAETIDIIIKTIEDNIKGKKRLQHIKFNAFEETEKLKNTLTNYYDKAKTIATEEKISQYSGDFDFDSIMNDLINLPSFKENLNLNSVSEAFNILEKTYSLESVPSVDLLNWIKQGIELNKNSAHCLFCGSLIENIEKIEDKYNKYLSNDKQKDIQKLNKIRSELSSFSDSLKSFLDNKNLYNKCGILITDETDLIKKRIDNLDNFIKQIDKKMDNFNVQVHVNNKKFNFNDGAIETELKSIEEKKNSSVKALQKQESSVACLIKGHIAKEILNNTEFNNKVVEYNNALNEYISAKEENNNIDREISLMQNKISAVGPFADFINSILQDLDIKFKLEIIEDNYMITPLISSSEISVNDISEGEKNLLSFLFFYYELFDDLEKSVFKDEIKYIIIDDPISSLDDNNKFYLQTVIRNLINDFSHQIFVLTHDWQFFCALLYGKHNLRNKDSKISAFEVKKDSNYCSYLDFANPTISPYEHDFIELINARLQRDKNNLSVNDVYHLPNCMRRVLETFLSFKSVKSSPTENNFEEVKKTLYPNEVCGRQNETNLRRLLQLINYNSHFAAHNSEEVYNSVRYLLNTLEHADKSHYNMINAKYCNSQKQ